MDKLETAFPTIQELIRDLAQLLDLSFVNKKGLDDKIQDSSITKAWLTGYQTEIDKQLMKILPPEITELIQKYIRNVLDEYLINIVGKIDVEGLHRSEVKKLLTGSYFPYRVSKFLLSDLPEKYQLPDILRFFSPSQTSISVVLECLENKEEWQNYVASLTTKEERTQISRWNRAEYLPSFIALVNLRKTKSQIGQIEVFCFWLFIARAVDELRLRRKDTLHLKFLEGMNIWLRKLLDLDSNSRLKQLLEQDISSLLSSQISQYQRIKFAKLMPMLRAVFQELQFKKLSLIHPKSKDDKEEAYMLINHIREFLSKNHELDNQAYRWDWLEARWHLLSGNLEKAVEVYEQAFQKALYRAGDMTRNIIQEAVIATSFLEQRYKKSKRKFLAHLKNIAVLFQYELPSIEANPTKINHKEIVADWEVDLWARAFGQYFPKESWYEGVDYELFLPRKAALSFAFEEKENAKPDFRNVNRIINFKGTKKMPQLVLFTSYYANGNYVKQLLERGADVNKMTDVNESALLFALEHLNLHEMGRSQNQIFFDLISQYPHNTAVINTKTSKQQKFPLMLAVESGRADIVAKVLEMGAVVDMVDFDGKTPLYQAVRLLHYLRGSEKSPSELMYSKLGPAGKERLAEYFRRTNQTPFASIPKHFYSNNEMLQMIAQLVDKGVSENIKKYSSAESLHQIIGLLLQAGANPNFPVDLGDLKGYTPLMMAIELNDPIAFHMLMNAGGDLARTFISMGNIFSCSDIKKNWKSYAINLNRHQI